MGSQGLVTVTREDGTVLLKAVAGMDGYYAKKLASEVKARWPLTVDEVYEIALRFKFGTPRCLAVITEKETKFEGDYDLSELYQSTFDQPRFNPRWKHGTADHIEVVVV
jgi:hypothetical protein